MRKDLALPPFVKMVRVIVFCKVEDDGPLSPMVILHKSRRGIPFPLLLERSDVSPPPLPYGEVRTTPLFPPLPDKGS